MQQCQTPAEGCLVVATAIQPGQQQHRTMGQCRQGDGLRHNQERGIGLGMQGLKGLRLHLKQGQRAGATAFGKQQLAITEAKLPGLMNAATTHGGDIRDHSPRQWPVLRGEIPAQFAVHPRQAPCLASMARFFRAS